jgi:hypothetical protein
VDGMYLYPLKEYCIYLYILRYGVQEVKENVCLGFYDNFVLRSTHRKKFGPVYIGLTADANNEEHAHSGPIFIPKYKILCRYEYWTYNYVLILNSMHASSHQYSNAQSNLERTNDG